MPNSPEHKLPTSSVYDLITSKFDEAFELFYNSSEKVGLRANVGEEIIDLTQGTYGREGLQLRLHRPRLDVEAVSSAVKLVIEERVINSDGMEGPRLRTIIADADGKTYESIQKGIKETKRPLGSGEEQDVIEIINFSVF